MRQPTFRQILLKVVASRLKEWGYQYDKSLEDRAIMYGFSKRLREDIQTAIVFQRHQYEEVPYGYGFTVNLNRRSMDASGQLRFRHNEGDFSTRLGSIIMGAYGLRLYPYWDQWWEAATPDHLKIEMDDAVRRLDRYGVPALEDLDFRDTLPGGMPGEWNIFQDTVDAVVAVDLSQLGYESKVDPDNRLQPSLRPRRHFVKQHNTELYSLIGFEPLKCTHRPTVNDQGLELRWFAVSIATKRSSDPNAELETSDKTTFQGWLGPDSFTRSSIKPIISDAVLWEHAALALPLQLSVVLDKIKQHGIPMLEQSLDRDQ